MIKYFAGKFRLYDVYEGEEFIAIADNLNAAKQIAKGYDADTDGECEILLYEWTGGKYQRNVNWRY